MDHVHLDLLGDLHDGFDDLPAVKLRRICQGIAQLGSLSVRAFQIVYATKCALQLSIVFQDSVLSPHCFHLHILELGCHDIDLVERVRQIVPLHMKIHQLVNPLLNFFDFPAKA